MREEKELKGWKLVNFCEFDKYAIKSYCAIHGVDENLNLGDITKVDETNLEDFNMMTWGFPCTDISCAGKQQGFLDEDGNKPEVECIMKEFAFLDIRSRQYQLLKM